MARTPTPSTRRTLRAFQKALAADGGARFESELDLLQAKDLDASVRLGALLAADALLITTAINPIAASPGAPLSLDAATQPWQVGLVCLCIAALAVAAWYCVRGILVGEEFEFDGEREDGRIAMQRMLAAWCRSVDAQLVAVRLAARFTVAGGGLMIIAFGWILVGKIWL